MHYVFIIALALFSSAFSPNAQAAEIHCFMPIIKLIAKEKQLVDWADKHNATVKIPQDIDAIEKKWGALTPEDSSLEQILDNPASDILKRQVANNDYFQEMFLVDRHGVVVASSGKTSDYFQADEEFYSFIIAHGKNSVFIAGEENDQSALVVGQKVSIPVMEGDSIVAVLCVIINSWYNDVFKAC